MSYTNQTVVKKKSNMTNTDDFTQANKLRNDIKSLWLYNTTFLFIITKKNFQTY